MLIIINLFHLFLKLLQGQTHNPFDKWSIQAANILCISGQTLLTIMKRSKGVVFKLRNYSLKKNREKNKQTLETWICMWEYIKKMSIEND